MASGRKVTLIERLRRGRSFGLFGEKHPSVAHNQDRLSGYDQAYILGHSTSSDSWHIQVLREQQPAEYIPVSRSTLPVIMTAFDELAKTSEMTEPTPNLIAKFVAALERAEAAGVRLRAAIEHADRNEIRAQHTIKTSQELIERAHS